MATTLLQFYEGSDSPIGRVEYDGRVYDDVVAGYPVGRVEPNGRVYNDPYLGSLVGHVDVRDGGIYRGFYPGGTLVGRVARDGRVYNDGFGGTYVGRADGHNKILCGGALYLLLL